MQKKLLKILETISAVVVFFIAQYHIRQYYSIDPRIWLFVVFGISFVGFLTIWGAFYSEINSLEEYFKTHSFSKFISEISKKVKPITEKVVNSFIFNLLHFITFMTVFTGVMYKCFFHDDFIARTALYIVFLVMIAWTALIRIIRATVIEKEKRTKELVYGGMWVFIFLTNFLEFVCI